MSKPAPATAPAAAAKPAAPAAKPAASAPAASAAKPQPTAAESLEKRVYGTQEQQDKREANENKKETVDNVLDYREKALQGKEVVGELKSISKTPISGLSKGAGLFKSGPEANFGEIRDLVRFAMARNAKQKYQVALDRRKIYVRIVFVNNARANVRLTGEHYPSYNGRASNLSEMGPFRWNDLTPSPPEKKDGTVALIGGSSSGSWLRGMFNGGNFIKAGLSFNASSANHSVDFSVGFDWDPDKAGQEKCGLVLGANPAGGYSACSGQAQEKVSNGFMINVMIKGQTAAVGISRVA